MKTMQTRSHNIKMRGGRVWLGVLIPLALVAIAAGLFLYIADVQRDDDDVQPEPKTLQVGKDYYLMVRTIELYPKRPGGETAWDRVDGSGPDIQFNLTWQGNVVFESQQKGDTLIGAWDALSLDVKAAVLKGKVDLAGSIDAAIISVEEDTEVTIEVWDNDLPGSDSAGAAIMKLEQFKPGDNTFTFDPTEKNAIKRIVVRVIDKALPITELVEEATRP
ncbi:MAG: hypothetical protein KTR15_08235 [Phycisphaeraceae bacterium]|nr:hypothetical protein [Phycisphaeraceae bacterium]